MTSKLTLVSSAVCRSRLFAFLLVTLAASLGAAAADAAEVNGIYTEPSTKDLGELTKIDLFKGLKFRGWIDTYLEGNFNHPRQSTVNENQALSVIRSRDLTIEGRTFDVHDRSFSLSLAELEFEKVPDVGGVGFKLDLAWGDTMDIIVDSIKAAIGNQSVSDFDRYVQHASIAYVAPIGKGLRFDVGKFVTHIGGETIETIKNNNYSHAFFYTYAIPFQDTGVRVHYDWTDAFYTELYVVNGWNATSDNNKAKTLGPSIGWSPSPKFSVYLNYLVGNERTDSDKQFENLRHLVDAQVNFAPIEPLNLSLNADYAVEDGAIGGRRDAQWYGLTGWIRYKLTDALEPSLRVEWYRDEDGFTTGVAQTLVGITATLNYKIGLGKLANILLRPEYRVDFLNKNFFTRGSDFRSEKVQHTLGIGAVLYF